MPTWKELPTDVLARIMGSATQPLDAVVQAQAELNRREQVLTRARGAAFLSPLRRLDEQIEAEGEARFGPILDRLAEELNVDPAGQDDS